jgi:uncharacterized membrane protein
MKGNEEGPLGRIVQRTLEIGVAVAVVLLASGLALAVALGGFGPDALVGTARPASVLAGAGSEIGLALILLGVFALVATPIARVGVSLGFFARARDREFTLITASVLGVLAFTVLVGLLL